MALKQRNKPSFVAVNLTKLNPFKNNAFEKYSADLHLMGDSGAMCCLLNFEAVKKMGINPEGLETANVNITGING